MQPHLVFVASHLGYPMERTPLGGGAMVGIQLARHWAKDPRVRLTLFGSGSHSPGPGLSYTRLPETPSDPDLVRYSELQYARFCRGFEEATTACLLRQDAPWDPKRTVIVVNDISESPDVARLAARGFRLVSLWHVDVVEFFNRIYLGNCLAPERLTRAYTGLQRGGLAGLVPDMLKLVFQKQQDAVRYSDRLGLPSRQMAATIERCYAHLPHEGKPPLKERSLVVPWGCWAEEIDDAEVLREASRLKAHYQLREDTRVLMTLSRISPEKGIVVLLEALKILEDDPRFEGADLVLFICGESAFMRGESYDRRVRRAAAKLKRFRVFFPGYLSSFDKQAYFRLARLFVSPSIHESYGLTLVEAMQAGLPILASDHYGVEEILGPDTGRVVSYGEGDRAARMAEGLREMLRDPAALKAMGAKAREAASSMTFSGAAQRLLDAALELME